MDLPLFDTDLKFFQVQGREYVLDIPTSTLFEIHPNIKKILEQSIHNLSANYLDELKREFHLTDWMELMGELKHMIDYRHLTIYSSRITPYELKEQKINSISLNICHDCNMCCTYCYQGGGTFGKDAEYMDKDVALKAIEFLFKETPDSRVYFYISGGEPFLNPDLIKFIVRNVRENEEKYEKEAFITIFTNGTLLDMDLLCTLKAENVELVIALDGGTEEHNQLRVMQNQQPSLDCIKDKLKWVKESGITYRIKGILHHRNASALLQIWEYCKGENYPLIDFEPVIAPVGVDYALTQEDLESIKVTLSDLFRAYEENDLGVQRIANINTAVECIACQHNLGYTCGAGKNYLSITPNGDIYPCHLLVGRKEFYLGNIVQGKVNQDLRKRFYQPLHVLNRESCRSCWARYFCGGGCVGENYLINNSLITPYSARCELTRFEMDKAIRVYCSMLQDDDKLNFNSERRKSGREIYKIS